MNKIKVIVDQNAPNEGENVKGARSMLENLVDKVKQTSIEVDANALVDQVENIYTALADSISRLQSVNENVEIEDVQFTIGIDSTGQASLVSTVGLSAQTKTGITFKIKPKSSECMTKRGHPLKQHF